VLSKTEGGKCFSTIYLLELVNSSGLCCADMLGCVVQICWVVLCRYAGLCCADMLGCVVQICWVVLCRYAGFQLKYKPSNDFRSRFYSLPENCSILKTAFTGNLRK
jgi:hypothetical protein